MISRLILQAFYELLSKHSERNSFEMPQLSQKGSKICPITFTINFIKNLQLGEQVALAGLLLAKRAIDNNLKIGKKFLHRLIVVCIMIAQKCNEEVQNNTEVFSLLSGIPIKDINSIQNKLLVMLEYRIIPTQSEVDKIFKGDIEGLFLERIYN